MAKAPGVSYFNKDLGVVMHKIGESRIDSPPLSIYSDLLEGFAWRLNRNVENHYQNVVGYVGSGTGTGKSSCALRVIKLQDPFCSMEEAYTYSIVDLAWRVSQPVGSITPMVWMDEGTVILNSKRHMTKESIDITTLFDTMRTRGESTHICAPELSEIDDRVRSIHMNYLMVCGERSPVPGYTRRGFCKLFMKTKASSFSKKVFWKPVGWGVFKPMSRAEKEEYDVYKKAAQERINERFVSRYLETAEAERCRP